MWAYDNVIRMINTIGRQASTLLGFNGMMITIVLAFIRIFGSLQHGLIIAAAILFLMSAVFCTFTAFLTTGWAYPVPVIERREMTSTNEKCRETIIESIIKSLKWNMRFRKKCGLILFASLIMTLSGVILLTYVILAFCR